MWVLGSITAAATTIPVSVDPRVELISIIFRLAGNPEYNGCEIHSYSQDIKTHFAPFTGHQAVELARELRKNQGVSYDAPMGLAVHLSEGFDLEPRLPFTPLPPASTSAGRRKVSKLSAGPPDNSRRTQGLQSSSPASSPSSPTPSRK